MTKSLSLEEHDLLGVVLLILLASTTPSEAAKSTKNLLTAPVLVTSTLHFPFRAPVNTALS